MAIQPAPASFGVSSMAYMMIKNTDKWSSQDFKAAGQGRVHDKMYREVLGCDYSENRSACGGFGQCSR